MDLTLQALLRGSWQDIALLEFPSPELGPAGRCNFEYSLEHLRDWLVNPSPLATASVRLPLVFGPECLSSWPAFLDDLRPLGSARGWWLKRLGLPDTPASDFALLRAGAIAPPGNLRIKEALPPKGEAPRKFALQAVIDRDYAFLEYAAGLGVQVGGATGAGGDSPKLLLRLDEDEQVWIDTWQDDPTNPDHHYLVKFARGARTPRDQVILRSEYSYYRALTQLGIDTVPAEGLMLHEGQHGPSLWMRRFDVTRRKGKEVRLGVESIYSLMGARPGAWLAHQDVLEALSGVFGDSGFRRIVLEYLRRDLLNVVFGNSDNHGRNMALLKTSSRIALAPVYDFAPMTMDPEGITRTTRWRDFEQGDIDWPGLLASFGRDEAFLRAGLRDLAQRLCGLPKLLTDLGTPDETLSFPGVGLSHLDRRLKKWTLL